VQRAKFALSELGYTPGLRLSNREERAYLKSGYEYTFDSSQGRNLVEIKWNILPRFYAVEFDTKILFARAVKVEIGGASMQTLCPEDLMIVLCVHAAKHAWVQLSWLYDIAKFAKLASIDCGEVMCRARRLGVEWIVAVMLSLANRLLGTPLPTLIKADQDVERMATRVVPIIIGRTKIDPDSLTYFRLMIDTRERTRDRLRFVWRLAFTPSIREWSTIKLPQSLFPLYRLVRAARLAKRFI
jgi:hypothetical protein